MLEILQFIFSDFWIWLGVLIMLGLVVQALLLLCIDIRNKKHD